MVEHSERQQCRMDTVHHEPSLGDVIDEADDITIDHHQVQCFSFQSSKPRILKTPIFAQFMS